MIEVKTQTIQLEKNKYRIILSVILILVILSCSTCSEATLGLKPKDSWVLVVKKARRNFEYSFGNIKFSSRTIGYRLGDELVPLQELINVSILSIESTDPETIIYQINWNETSVISNSSSELFENGIIEALGRGVLGSGYEFLLSDSGVSIGDWVFVVPVDTLLSSSLQYWNQTTLPGTIEGLETILELGEDDNENDYHIWILYEGNLANESMGINLEFTFDASFRWEKSTGVLLVYEIIARMTGTYEQTFDAVFALDLRLERTDLSEIISKAAPGFNLILLISGFIILIISRAFLRRKKSLSNCDSYSTTPPLQFIGWKDTVIILNF